MKLERWQLEADIKSLETTGAWVDGVIPEWAAQQAVELHCRPASAAVIQWGLQEIIRMLKEELFTAECRIPVQGTDF
jgi:hypothetical protein